MLTLIKMSGPGWEKEFESETELKAELYKHICSHCCKGSKGSYYDDDGKEIEWEDPPITEDSSLEAMLGTACGCEYWYENNELADSK